METIFSAFISGEIHCDKVYENDQVLAFLDVHPVNYGHALVIPKTWSKGLLDAKPEDLEAVMLAVQVVAKAVKEATGAGGINIIQNEGEIAGQKIEHLHFHVIPRHVGDGVEAWHGKPYPSPHEKQALAEKIRSKIG